MFETMFERMSKVLDGLNNEQLTDAVYEAKAKKVNPYIIAALVAEATVRGIELD